MTDHHAARSSVFAKASPEMLQEVIREAELYLTYQVQLALASDQRALTFSSVVGAVLAGVIGSIAVLHSTGTDPALILPWAIPLIICGGVSLLFAITASRPVDFATPGNNPRVWAEDIEAGQSLHQSLAEMVALYERSITDNSEVMIANARAMTIALRWSAGGLFLGCLGSIVAVSV